MFEDGQAYPKIWIAWLSNPFEERNRARKLGRNASLVNQTVTIDGELNYEYILSACIHTLTKGHFTWTIPSHDLDLDNSNGNVEHP